MKKILIRAVIILILLLNITTYADQMFVDSHNGLRVREEPNLTSKILQILPHGSMVEVVRFINNNNWAKIQYKEGYAYVHANYIKSAIDDHKGMTYLGNFMITAYAATGNPCANGNYPEVGYTVACNSLNFETKIYIDGIGERTVQDRGPASLGNQWLDLYLGDPGTCYAWGVQYRDVYLIEE